MSSLIQAATISTSSSSSPDPELFTPPPSHATLRQVPDVFVIPPEEEHEDNPPFCYFDAAMESRKSLSILPDIDALDVALGMCQQTDNRAPIFHRSGNESQDTIVMPKRGVFSQDDRKPRRRMVDGDGDVVEVVKVRRNEKLSNTPSDSQSSLAMKKSKTFRARASQALRSIKNVGKTARKPGVPEEWAVGRENDSNEVVEAGMLARASTPSLAGRRSIQISQIFASVRSKSPTPDVPTSPTSPTSPVSRSSTTSSSDWEAMSRPSVSTEECMNSPFPMTVDPADERPSISNKRSFVRRISARDIQRLFTVSNPAKPPSSEPLRRQSMAPSASHSPSHRESVLSSRTTASTGLSSLGDSFGNSASRRPHSFHGGVSELAYTLSLPESLSSLQSSPSADGVERADGDEGEASFELRLDSLHFDSLQFDPEEFR